MLLWLGLAAGHLPPLLLLHEIGWACLHGRRLLLFALDALLALNVKLVLLELLVLLLAHVVDALISVLVELVEELTKVYILLVSHFLKVLLH